MLAGAQNSQIFFRFKSSSTIGIRTDRRQRIIDWPAKTLGKSLLSRSTRFHKLHECQLSLLRLGLLYRERQTTKFPRDESSSRLFTSLLWLGYCQAEGKRKQFRRSEINFHRSFSLSCRAIRAAQLNPERNFVPRNRNEKSIYCNNLCRRFKRFAWKSLCESGGWTASCSDSHLNIQMRRLFMLA